MRLHNLLKKEGIEPDLVSLDQCFMKNPEIIRLIIKTADLKKTDVVCEIGAGTGILTSKMSRLCGKVFAVEKDARLYNLLSSLLGKKENVEIIIGDAKKCGFFNANKIVSNLPYGILDWFFEELDNYDFDLAVVTIPLKFYEKQLNKYDNLVPEIIKMVEPCDFYPQPGVRSVVVKIKKKKF